MSYVPAWERLSAAVNRVMAAKGQPKGEVQRNIGQAIADRAIKIRGKLKEHTTKHLTA